MRSEMKVTRRAVLNRGLRGAASVGAAWLGAGFYAPRVYANALRVGLPAPPATLMTLDGTRIASSDLIGRVVILTFWATWCAPCREELPLLSAYAAQHADALTVLGFSLDGTDKLPQVTQLSKSFSFPVGLAMQSSVPGYGRIWRLPVNFTIDRNGLLVEDGWKEKEAAWTAERLEHVVTPLLK